MKTDTPPSSPGTGGGILALIPFASAFIIALISFSCGTSRTELLADVNSVEKRFSAKLQPAVRTWIDEEAMKLARFVVEQDGVGETMGRRFAGQNLGNDGREVLTFLAMARAADLVSQRAKLFEEYQKAIRATAERMREVLPKLEADLKRNTDVHDLAPVPLDCARYQDEIRRINELMQKTPSRTVFVDRPFEDIAELRAVQDDLKGKLDGMNEMSEMTSMRLQMMMDRRRKFIETLSNVMKKISTTQETLVQNLK